MVLTRNADVAAAMAAAVADEPGIYAAAAVELAGGRRWLMNSRPMRAASLIKIFIMAEAFRLSEGNGLDLEEMVPIAATPAVGGAGSLQHAPPDTVKSWRELVELMIVESDNIATNLLIDRLGMAGVNALAAALGCRDTVLRRRMMDFAAAAAGRENHTSPADVALALEKLYRGEWISPAADAAMVAILLKSGELEGAEHDAGIVYGEGCDYVLAVMSDGLPDPERGRGVIARLSRTVYDVLHNM